MVLCQNGEDFTAANAKNSFENGFQSGDETREVHKAFMRAYFIVFRFFVVRDDAVPVFCRFSLRNAARLGEYERFAARRSFLQVLEQLRLSNAKLLPSF